MEKTAEKIKIDDLKKYYYLSQLKYSEKGSNVALIGKIANNKNGYYSTIFVNKGEGFYPLTGKKGNVSSYIWLDDETILFSEVREAAHKEKIGKGYELTPYYRININIGEAELAFTADAFVSDIKKAGENRFVLTALFDNNRPDILGKPAHEQEMLLNEFNGSKTVKVIDELPYWSNGAGYVNKKRKRLYLCDHKTGLTALTSNLSSVSDFKISSCGRFAAFTGNLQQGDIKPVKSNLYYVNLENKTTETLLKEDMFIKTFDFCGKDLVFTASFGENFYFQEHPSFYRINPDTKAVAKIRDFDRSIESTVGSDCVMGSGILSKVFDGHYYFVYTEGFYADIYSLCIETGEIVNITDTKGNISMFDVSEKGIVFNGMLHGRLQEIYDLKGSEAVKISSFNDEIYESRKHPELNHHVITDSEGVEFDGWVMYPVDYDENKKYPAILNIHGGPKTVYGDVFFHEMQYWASEGYFVFFSNPRGSDGKGNVFADLRGLYGTIDYDNLMQFTEEMADRYTAVDKERIGVTGGSYGGYMVNWMVGHTHRFKAGVSQRSISNWVSYAIGDLGYFFTDHDIKANTWNNTEKLWWHSPLKYADKAKTPTLFIHSQEDYRCCVPEALQMFSALKLHGVDTKLVLFEGENHELSRSGKPEHRVRRLSEITRWMDKYLK